MSKSSYFMRLCTVVLFCITVSLSAQTRALSVSLGYIPHVQFAPFYIAEINGHFAKENLKVEIKYISSLTALTMIAQKGLDIALVDSDQVIFSRSKGLPVQIFYQYYQKFPISIFTTDQTLTHPEKLVGKTIGVPELSGTSYVGLMIFLAHYRLKDKVKILSIGYEQIALLTAKKIDAAVGYSNNEPIFFTHSGTQFQNWPLSQIAPLMASSGLAANQDTLQKESEVFHRFVRALKNATQDILQNPDASFEKIVPLLRISPSQKPLMKEIYQNTLTLLLSLDTKPKLDSYTWTIEKMKELGFIKKTIPTEDMLNTNF